LVLLTPYIATIFDHLRNHTDTTARVGAVDMRNGLLVLPFLMHDLLANEVAELNSRLPAGSHIVDPSAELIEESNVDFVVSLAPSPSFSQI
jgi:hypothetical protein